MPGDEVEPSFEAALKGLEEIVDQLEQGQVDLEEALSLFERGNALARRCRERLARAEQRLTELAPEEAAPGPP